MNYDLMFYFLLTLYSTIFLDGCRTKKCTQLSRRGPCFYVSDLYIILLRRLYNRHYKKTTSPFHDCLSKRQKDICILKIK